MKNHPCTQEDIDEKRWICRPSCTCFVSVFNLPSGIHVLAAKRGPKMEEGGKWALIGGFVEYDETLNEACIREFKEETAGTINLCADDLKSWKVQDDPRDSKNQNITHRFYTENLTRINQIVNDALKLRHRELAESGNQFMLDLTNGETEQIKLIDLKELNKYDWAFNHFSVIMEYIQSGLI